MFIIYFLISFIACLIGAISGLGGGVMIKPILDLLGTMNVSTISFLSGCTVFSMAIVTLYRTRHSDIKIDKKKTTILALGAALGGLLGSYLFSMVKLHSGNPDAVGAIQSFILAAVTMAILIYTLNKSRIKSFNLTNVVITLLIGIILGCLSSFLGIGGGPINLAVLYLFFSMDSRTAALNSIYLISFSQGTTLLQKLFTDSVPPFELPIFMMMVSGGLLGGFIGPIISKKLSIQKLEQLFNVVIIFIIIISIYNGFAYLGMV